MIFVIGGVTASGKSALAFKLAKATNGIIINADAFAIYKELNIGTAKPSDEELNSAPTYLFNIISLVEKYSIYNYQQDARKIINEYKNTNRPIIFVGGSGLYIRAALYNYELQSEELPPLVDDPQVSNASLHERLKALDKEAAMKIHPNNRKRVLRALSIIENSNVLKTEIDQKTLDTPLFPFVMITLDADQDELETRIKERTTSMFSKGLRAEVQSLISKYPQNAQGLQAIGYKEIIANHTQSDEYLIDLISLRTRQFAKRQRTFFRNQFISTWFYNSDKAYVYLLKKYEEFKDDKKH